METKELMHAYKVIDWAMKENKKASYNKAFATVKNWLANYICDRLDDGQIIETLETFNKV